MSSPKNKSTENFEIKNSSIDYKILKICKQLRFKNTVLDYNYMCTFIFYSALCFFIYFIFYFEWIDFMCTNLVDIIIIRLKLNQNWFI